MFPDLICQRDFRVSHLGFFGAEGSGLLSLCGFGADVSLARKVCKV